MPASPSVGTRDMGPVVETRWRREGYGTGSGDEIAETQFLAERVVWLWEFGTKGAIFAVS